MAGSHLRDISADAQRDAVGAGSVKEGIRKRRESISCPFRANFPELLHLPRMSFRGVKRRGTCFSKTKKSCDLSQLCSLLNSVAPFLWRQDGFPGFNAGRRRRVHHGHRRGVHHRPRPRDGVRVLDHHHRRRVHLGRPDHHRDRRRADALRRHAAHLPD